ncbi:B-cell receptor CD22-like [Amphibalanus amphitrite]|uniref:B-cell receptor CD22-like n=1 Tax=Amphibalanus amphitrite TaxID=1232801 RepID=UPI001C916B5F|nr:B-cell receptor CD22-like [Amphibalanus amphitrite]
MTSHGSSQSRGIRLPFIWNGPMGSGALLVALISAAICLQAVAFDGLPHTIDAEEGTDVRIPCPQFREIQHPRGIRLVLWFRENENNPITSFDGRGRSRPGELAAGDPDLRLTRVTLGHSGRYRCRVDAEDDPTEVSWVQLTVHETPAVPSLKILGQYHDELNPTGEMSTVEYETARLICQLANGGGQTWNIAWLIRRPGEKEQLLSSETSRDNPSEQKLDYNVTRSDDSAALVCRAGTAAGESVSAEVSLRVSYGPDSVTLRCEPDAVAAGSEVTCACHVLPGWTGYKVTWLWGATFVADEHQSTALTSHHLPEKTSHQLTRVTSPDDDGRQVTCSVTNPVSGQERRANSTIGVQYAPKAILSGPSSELVEGNDAHFSCFVRAQPSAQFTFWLHNDRQLVSSDRIVAGPQLLIIKNLTPNDTGRYACFANNTLGAGLSNTVNLELKYAPVCRSEAVLRQFAAPSRVTFVSCRVRAQPRPSQFHWELQPANGGPTRTLLRSAHSDKGHSSVLQWTPTAGTDYGRLLCRATNSLGRQLEPCRVDLVPPERPDPVHNCTVSLSEAVISCTPGPDGGMANWYTLWLYGPNEQLVGNWTENQPHFIVPVSSLPPGQYRAEVTAESPAGRSETTSLQFRPQPSVGSHTDESGEFSVNSWVLGGAIFALLAVVALVIVSVHVRCHCTPISDVGSCRSSPDRSELLRQRSCAPQQQPIYAEVQRRRSPHPPPPPPRRLSCDEPGQPHYSGHRTSRSRTPQPPERGYRERSRTPQPPEHTANGRDPLHRSSSLLPSPVQRGPSEDACLSHSSADVRHEDPESAVQVHLQPPTPASTASTTSTVDDQAEVHTPEESEEGAEDAYQDLQDPDTAPGGDGDCRRAKMRP